MAGVSVHASGPASKRMAHYVLRDQLRASVAQLADDPGDQASDGGRPGTAPGLSARVCPSHGSTSDG